MRDPKRIPEALNELKGVWGSFPDLRLGQLILNAVSEPTLYYVEDSELLKILRESAPISWRCIINLTS